jgi:hypothetical protein
MKKLVFISLLSGLVLTISAQPRIWSVSKDAAQKADYSEIQAAIDAASPGDYIYVYPSVYDNGFTLGIPLVIVGPGYFLGDNLNTQVNKSPASIKEEVIIGTNTSGALIAGLDIQSKLIVQSTSNVIVKRNKLHSVEIKNAANITIKQNYIFGTDFESGYKINDKYSVCPVVFVGANSSNIKLYNNYLKNEHTSKLGDWGQYHTAIATHESSSALVMNNVIYGHLAGYNMTFQNNILTDRGEVVFYNCSMHNNVAFNSAFGNGNGNQENVAMTTVFASSESTDGQYQLKNGSPAKGAGLDGVDCGMFGGPEPYVLSGIPDIPVIYFFEAPDGASATNGLPVHIKVKSRQ